VLFKTAVLAFFQEAAEDLIHTLKDERGPLQIGLLETCNVNGIVHASLCHSLPISKVVSGAETVNIFGDDAKDMLRFGGGNHISQASLIVDRCKTCCCDGMGELVAGGGQDRGFMGYNDFFLAVISHVNNC